MGSAVAGAVIIPAHDEASVIAATLRGLLAEAGAGELDVVVVCNGCTDDTAAVARAAASSVGQPVRVIELPRAGKAAALRAAEPLDLPYPRLYLDADVQCPASTARALLAAVRNGADVAVPARRLDLRGASPLAAAYYRAWESLPWVQAQLAGRGAYAVSAALQPVLAALPDVVADDRLVTTSVPRERATVVEQPVTIRPPGRLRDVVNVRSRVYAGNVVADAPTHDASSLRRGRALVSTARRPASWPGLAVFLAVSAAAKVRAARSVRGPDVRWERDSARTAPR